MRNTPRLLEAIPRGDYTVHLRFEDGTEADVDLGYLTYLGGVFEPLGDAEYFRQLRVYSPGQTIFWPRHPGAQEGEQAEDVSSVQCQRPSRSPQRRPSNLPSRGHLFSPPVAIGSPHA